MRSAFSAFSSTTRRNRIQGIRKSVSESAGLQPGTMMDLWIGVLPFMAGIAICLTLLFIFPGIALWLPNLVMGR